MDFIANYMQCIRLDHYLRLANYGR